MYDIGLFAVWESHHGWSGFSPLESLRSKHVFIICTNNRRTHSHITRMLHCSIPRCHHAGLQLMMSPLFQQHPLPQSLLQLYAEEKKNLLAHFPMCAISAVVSVTAAAPIARVKLLIQNQNEIIKVGRLYESYKGIGDCFKRTIQEEGVFSLWRGNTASVIRHVPAHVT